MKRKPESNKVVRARVCACIAALEFLRSTSVSECVLHAVTEKQVRVAEMLAADATLTANEAPGFACRSYEELIRSLR